MTAEEGSFVYLKMFALSLLPKTALSEETVLDHPFHDLRTCCRSPAPSLGIKKFALDFQGQPQLLARLTLHTASVRSLLSPVPAFPFPLCGSCLSVAPPLRLWSASLALPSVAVLCLLLTPARWSDRIAPASVRFGQRAGLPG